MRTTPVEIADKVSSKHMIVPRTNSNEHVLTSSLATEGQRRELLIKNGSTVLAG